MIVIKRSLASDQPTAYRDTSLDILRGIASLIVALHHGAEWFFPPYVAWERNWINFGRVGVVVFFMISGYLFANEPVQSTRPRFVVRRMFRILPTYYLALILYTLTNWPVREVDLVAGLVMIQTLLGNHMLVPTSWTLPIELLFYLVVCVGIPASLVYFRRAAWFFAGLTITVSVVALICGLSLPTTVPLLVAVSLTAGCWRLVSEVKQGSQRDPWFLLLIVFLGISVLVSALAQAAHDPKYWTFGNYSISVLIGITLFIAVHNHWTKSRVAEFVGKVSYSLYLIHPLVLSQVVGLCIGWSAVVLYLLLSLAFSWILYQLVERPAMKWGSTVISSRKFVRIFG